MLEDAGEQSLEELVAARGPLPLNMVRDLTRQLLHAVDHLNRHSVCHRDLKPDNLVVTQQGERFRLKLIDFNVAWDSSKSPLIYGASGTVAFSAPETRRWLAYNEKCDVWSVAFIVLFMLSGEIPDASENWARYVPLDSSDNRFLNHLLTRMLCTDPQERISSSEAVMHPWIS